MAFEDLFHPTDLATLLNLADDAEKRIVAGGKFEYYGKIEDGEHLIAICPSWRAEPPRFLHKMTYQHYRVGPGKGEIVWCAEANGNGKCPICFVINLMIANGAEYGIDNDTFRRQRAGSQACFNVVPLVRQGSLFVPKDNPPRAKILQGPSRLADWVYAEGKSVTDEKGNPNFFDPTCAMAIKINRFEEGGFTKYSFNWAIAGTGRTVLVKTQDEAESLSSTIRDLDRAFGSKWNDDEWTKAVDLAQKMMQLHRFKPLPIETIKHHCPPPGKKRSQDDAPPTIVGDGQLRDITVGLAGMAAPPTLPPLQTARTETVSEAAVEIKLSPINRDPTDLDPSNLDPATGKPRPRCFGNQNAEAVCSTCFALGPCVMATLSRTIQGAH
jgi:hypothetical protein